MNIVVGAGMELGGPAGAAQRRAPTLGRRSRDAPRFTPKRRGVPNIDGGDQRFCIVAIGALLTRLPLKASNSSLGTWIEPG